MLMMRLILILKNFIFFMILVFFKKIRTLNLKLITELYFHFFIKYNFNQKSNYFFIKGFYLKSLKENYFVYYLIKI